MKRELKNKIWIFIYMVLFSQSIESQQMYYSVVKDTMMHKAYEISLLPNYKKNIFSYGEGVFVTYYYQDSTIVTIFSGGLQKLPLLSTDNYYIPCKIDTLQNRITRRGKKESKFWREDKYQGIIVYYDAVKKDRKCIYDFLLDNFMFYKIDPISKK
jgi:hypothetical protein